MKSSNNLSLRHKLSGTIACVALLFAAMPTAWSAEIGEAQAEAICKQAKKVPIPARDLPDKAYFSKDKNCNSIDYYDPAIGKPDFQKARWCAYVERKEDVGAPMLQGPGVLAMLYANGQGVPRNIPLATRFACEALSLAELEAGLADLQERSKTAQPTPFKTCDHASSALSANECALHEIDNHKLLREAQWKTMTARWSEAQKKAFWHLVAVSGKWFDQAELEYSTGAAPMWNSHWQMLEGEKNGNRFRDC
ncbi:hypothetical protein AB4090_13010 [Acidithiobacillus sp. IBUN Pt1247-S3]|uniref:hypothetical protein n=1 Tax=Acidithiobacillus sp. IBUN Pt1247-S3 TaxID=3166642 RepID=UPI0034E3B3D9